jgi:hypothetical protein
LFVWVLSPYSLPCGLVTVDLPHAWDLVDECFYEATFEFEEGRMSLHCLSYERPDVIESGDFVELFWDFLSKKHFEEMKPFLEQWWAQADNTPVMLSDRDQADDGEWYRNVWRQIEVHRPSHVRRLTWRFGPASRADGAGLNLFTEELHVVIVPRTRFAKDLTEFDRVAPSPTLKMVPMADSVFMRLPPNWKVERENEDGSGRRVIDEPERERWTLWLDWNQIGIPDPPANAAAERVLTESTARDIVPRLTTGQTDVLPGLGTDHLVRHRDAGDGLHTTTWHRVSWSRGSLFLTHTSFVVAEADAESPDISSVRDLIECEVMNAVLVPRHEREDR